MQDLKKCPKCGRKLPESEFYEDITQIGNLSVNCKECIKKFFKQNKEP